MSTVNIHTINGELVGETSATTRTDYLGDALGSNVAVVDSSATVLATYRYKPYGSRLAKTGTGAEPMYQWVGLFGSLVSARAFAEQYNVTRHYGTAIAVWVSVDPEWPMQPAYSYGASAPTTHVDPSGRNPVDLQKHTIYTCPADCGVNNKVKSPVAHYGHTVFFRVKSKYVGEKMHIIQLITRKKKFGACKKALANVPFPMPSYYELWEVEWDSTLHAYQVCNGRCPGRSAYYDDAWTIDQAARNGVGHSTYDADAKITLVAGPSNQGDFIDHGDNKDGPGYLPYRDAASGPPSTWLVGGKPIVRGSYHVDFTYCTTLSCHCAPQDNLPETV